MLQGLKNHPFSIEAFFDYSIVLSFAVPKEDVLPLVPDLLKLDLFQNKYAFFTIALVKVKDLRPLHTPKFFGQEFFLIGHRLYVQYHTKEGKRLRGLYVLRSQTDSAQMKIFGNIMTHYNYEKVKIASSRTENSFLLNAEGVISLAAKIGNDSSVLPLSSVFNTWKEARRFAGPLPFTFSAIAKDKMLIVEGVRNNWIPKPLELESINYDFSQYAFMKNAILSNAFIVENIPYHWKKGRIDKW